MAILLCLPFCIEIWSCGLQVLRAATSRQRSHRHHHVSVTGICSSSWIFAGNIWHKPHCHRSTQHGRTYCAGHGNFSNIMVGWQASAGLQPCRRHQVRGEWHRYGVVEANLKQIEIPDDVAYNAQGQPTTNPAEVLSGGALRSFDRYTW